MSKETIEVNIAGRSYPLSVLPEEVQGVQDAASAIDEATVHSEKIILESGDKVVIVGESPTNLSATVSYLEV